MADVDLTDIPIEVMFSMPATLRCTSGRDVMTKCWDDDEWHCYSQHHAPKPLNEPDASGQVETGVHTDSCAAKTTEGWWIQSQMQTPWGVNVFVLYMTDLSKSPPGRCCQTSNLRCLVTLATSYFTFVMKARNLDDLYPYTDKNDRTLNACPSPWSSVVKRSQAIIYVPTLTLGHELWVVNERTRSQIEAAEMSFLRKGGWTQPWR